MCPCPTYTHPTPTLFPPVGLPAAHHTPHPHAHTSSVPLPPPSHTLTRTHTHSLPRAHTRESPNLCSLRAGDAFDRGPVWVCGRLYVHPVTSSFACTVHAWVRPLPLAMVSLALIVALSPQMSAYVVVGITSTSNIAEAIYSILSMQPPAIHSVVGFCVSESLTATSKISLAAGLQLSVALAMIVVYLVGIGGTACWHSSKVGHLSSQVTLFSLSLSSPAARQVRGLESTPPPPR